MLYLSQPQQTRTSLVAGVCTNFICDCVQQRTVYLQILHQWLIIYRLGSPLSDDIGTCPGTRKVETLAAFHHSTTSRSVATWQLRFVSLVSLLTNSTVLHKTG